MKKLNIWQPHGSTPWGESWWQCGATMKLWRRLVHDGWRWELEVWSRARQRTEYSPLSGADAISILLGTYPVG